MAEIDEIRNFKVDGNNSKEEFLIDRGGHRNPGMAVSVLLMLLSD